MDWSELTGASMAAVQSISQASASSYKPAGHRLSLLLLNLHAADLMVPMVLVTMRISHTVSKKG